MSVLSVLSDLSPFSNPEKILKTLGHRMRSQAVGLYCESEERLLFSMAIDTKTKRQFYAVFLLLLDWMRCSILMKILRLLTRRGSRQDNLSALFCILQYLVRRPRGSAV
jgi:intergrase/recombinase